MKIVVNSTSQTLKDLLSAEDYGIILGYSDVGGFLLKNGDNRLYIETGKDATNASSFYVEPGATISINNSSDLLETSFKTSSGTSEVRILSNTGGMQYNETQGSIGLHDVDGNPISPATEEGQTTQEIMMAQLVSQLMLSLGNIGGSGNNRLSVDVGTIQNANPNVATIGNVTTVATLNNQLNQGSVSSFLTAQYLSDQYTYSYLNNITFS